MTMTEKPTLPEAVAVAIAAAIPRLANAKPEDVPDALYDLRTAWFDAIDDGEDVDGFAVADAIPHVGDPAIDDAIDLFLSQTWGDAIRRMPILLTFVDANPKRVLSGLRVLSFEAGKGGDDFETWREEAETALTWAMRLPEGEIPLRRDLLMDALEDAFFAGRQEGGIEGDPPAPAPHPVYVARITAARRAVADRLAETSDLDDLADIIRDEFRIHHGEAWLAVEEVSRAAAVAGDGHANNLRRRQVIGTHTWFVDFAERAQARGKLTVGAMIMRDQSRAFLAEHAA